MASIVRERIKVVRGRKVPLGTEGVCFWVGDSRYGARVGFKGDDGKTYFTALKNVEATTGFMNDGAYVAGPNTVVLDDIAMKNKFGEYEKAQEEKAFASDPDFVSFKKNWGGAAGERKRDRYYAYNDRIVRGRKKGEPFPARYKGKCKFCGTDIQVGAMIYWSGGKAWHKDCQPSANPKADAEYYAGRADGQRYLDEKAVYGEALAEKFAAEDEFNRYWKYGEDY